MRIVYYDESGDDGFPRYSSPLFALAAIYMHYLAWQPNFERIRTFRSTIRDEYGLPVKTEFHTKYFLLNKRPYRAIGLSEEDRLEVMARTASLLGQLDIRIVNVVIDKTRLIRPDFAVLDRALTYSVQRIENDLDPESNPEARFLMITDEGRVGAMRSTTRRIQRINYIPSRFGPNAYRREISGLIEDPLPKDSKESFFVQLADYVGFVVYLYALFVTGAGPLHGRMPTDVTEERVRSWMERMRPSLNERAAGDDPFGVKIHPRS